MNEGWLTNNLDWFWVVWIFLVIVMLVAVSLIISHEDKK